ncbi:MAG: SpvB/TcaC N-terminal domain-containing protein [candidate division FCPU426 bacterium]
MSDKSGISDQIISLPTSGGALKGLGEKFTPDLHTGTGNFSVPLALPPGRNGFQPQLNLTYSTGQGQGPFGLGWNLNLPRISRKTSKGVPTYLDMQDVFILSGAEDLVPVETGAGHTRYRPRTEGLFALITHFAGNNGDYWEVKARDGLISRYGTPRPASAPSDWQDPAVVVDPERPARIFSWLLTETLDTFGNRVAYDYEPDSGNEGPHRWSQAYLRRVRYVDYTDAAGDTAFLVSLTLVYELLTGDEPFSDCRAGFEIRTRRRCAALEVRTHAGAEQRVRTYALGYTPAANGASLLTRLTLTGHDQEATESMPPLEFKYSALQPERRDFFPLTGSLPPYALSHADFELADVSGNGLPDIVEMSGSVRVWRNLGRGRFAEPREMANAPAGARLAEPGVQFLDATGNGRPDLLITQPGLAGYYPLDQKGEWDARSFQAYAQAPGFDLEDPEVRLVDLDGDGVTDALRTGERLEHFFQEPGQGWTRLVAKERGPLETFPNVYFSDPRVKLADMNGDGLQDIVLLGNGRVDYWPNLGQGRWGRRVTMRHSPRFPEQVDPRRVLLGDADGDGAADLIFVEDAQVTLWLNRQGNAWGEPVVVHGTPAVTDTDAVRLADVLGAGVPGVLWSTDLGAAAVERYCFLDLTGGNKPYLLTEVDNNLGAVIRVQYASSVAHYLRDEQKTADRWQTSLPFPVQVVETVEVSEHFSGNTLTTSYAYHHGAWDGGEREFRGFGRVDQLDSERSGPAALDGPPYSPPALTRTWFYQGPLGPEAGNWQSPDFSREYWSQDPAWYPWIESSALAGLPRRALRDALRSLRGSLLRAELYGPDQSGRGNRPYTVIENTFGLREEEGGPVRVFFPHPFIQRTTEWERGDDPLTRVTVTDDYSAWGLAQQQTSVALPRRSRKRHPVTAAAVGSVDADETRILATHTQTQYALPDSGLYLHQSVAQTRTVELLAPPGVNESAPDDLGQVLRDQAIAAREVSARFRALLNAWQPGQPLPPDLSVLSHTVRHYDGPAFQGRRAGEVGPFGALSRVEGLAFTDRGLEEAYQERWPAYLGGNAPRPAGAPADLGSSHGYRRMNDDAEGHHAGFYADLERNQYDVQDASALVRRGLVLARQDGLSRQTQIKFDAYAFLPIAATDPAGLPSAAEYDYRVQWPLRLTDANGNSQCYRYTPLGMLSKQFLEGRQGEGGTEDEPELELAYDFAAYQQSRSTAAPQPIMIHTRRRTAHARAGSSDATWETREYSDGLGRLVQKREMAAEWALGADGEDAGLGPDQNQPSQPAAVFGDPERVTVSGWQVYDYRGRVVEKYESFFASGWAYAPSSERISRRPTRMYYDVRGRLVRSVFPNGAEQARIFGAPASLDQPNDYLPTPWEVYAYDPNDLAPASQDPGGHTLAGAAPASHHYTPASMVVNALGKIICQILRNGPDPALDWHLSRSVFDGRGNLLEDVDPLGRRAFCYAYDLFNRPLRTESLDAGTRTTVWDAAQRQLEYRDSKGSLVLQRHDVLNRVQEVWARDQETEALSLRVRVEYGDAGDAQQPASERQAQKQSNRLGRIHCQWDEAGKLTYEAYDFKGNWLEKTRRVVSDAALAQGWQAAWELPSAEAALDPQTFSTSMSYDALNRPERIQYPEDAEGTRKTLELEYSRGGALERIRFDGRPQVTRIAYNARGQRLLLAQGNSLMTRYAYDPLDFRLRRLRTERFVEQNSAYVAQGTALQDFAYAHDLAGNLISLEERTPGCGLAQGPDGRDRLQRRFVYDPLYRLLQADGRACQNFGGPRPWWDAEACGYRPAGPGPAAADQRNAPDLTEPYQEQYAYDPAGNVLSLTYRGGQTWSRQYMLDPRNNQVAGLQAGGESLSYAYDPSGNLIRQNTNLRYAWDHANRMIEFADQPAQAAAPSVRSRYLYDADGRRVKKWVWNQGANSAEHTVYIDALFEQHAWMENGVLRRNTQAHILDGQQRLAVLRQGPAQARDAGPAVQCHLSDHLGHGHLVTDDSGAWINREEFFPFGESSFGGFAFKRYRFAGKERDEESGWYYYGARYYAPWLAKWTSADSAPRTEGFNVYAYVGNNPLAYTDWEGEDGVYVQYYRNTKQHSPSDYPGKAVNPERHIVQKGALKGSEKATYFNCSSGAFLNMMKNAGVLQPTLNPNAEADRVQDFYKWASEDHNYLSKADWEVMRSIIGQQDQAVSRVINKIAALEGKPGSEDFILPGASASTYQWKSNSKTAVLDEKVIAAKLKEGKDVFTGVSVFQDGAKQGKENNHHYVVLTGEREKNGGAVMYDVQDPWVPNPKIYDNPEKAESLPKDEAVNSITHGQGEQNYHAYVEKEPATDQAK